MSGVLKVPKPLQLLILFLAIDFNKHWYRVVVGHPSQTSVAAQTFLISMSHSTRRRRSTIIPVLLLFFFWLFFTARTVSTVADRNKGKQRMMIMDSRAVKCTVVFGLPNTSSTLLRERKSDFDEIS